MKYMLGFLSQYGISIIHSIAITVISYMTFTFKKLYQKYSDEKIKKEVVHMVYKAINEFYPKLSSQDKLNQIIVNSKQILKEKHIVISDLELRIYIASIMHDFHYIKGSDLS